jgi:hypothetical protein
MSRLMNDQAYLKKSTMTTIKVWREYFYDVVAHLNRQKIDCAILVFPTNVAKTFRRFSELLAADLILHCASYGDQVHEAGKPEM